MDKQESTTSALQRVPFYDDTLLTLVDERTGKEYVLPKPMVDMFGLVWRSQHAKLTKSKLFAKGITKIMIPSAGGEQETLLLERRLVHAWLLSIDVNRIKPELQVKLLQYQEECADVLDAYFTKGHADNPRIDASHLPTLYDPMYQTMLQLVIDLDGTKHQVALLQEREHVRDQELIATQQKVIEGLLLAEQAHAKAEQAEESAQRAHDARDFFTVAEYLQFEYTQQQIPRREYKAISDHLQAYCMNKGFAFRRIPVGGKPWSEEYAFHRSVYGAALPGWLHRRYAQDNLTIIHRQEAKE